MGRKTGSNRGQPPRLPRPALVARQFGSSASGRVLTVISFDQLRCVRGLAASKTVSGGGDMSLLQLLVVALLVTAARADLIAQFSASINGQLADGTPFSPSNNSGCVLGLVETEKGNLCHAMESIPQQILPVSERTETMKKILTVFALSVFAPASYADRNNA